MTATDRNNRSRNRRGHQPAPIPEGPTSAEVAADLEPYRVVLARRGMGWTRAELADHLGGRLTPATVAQVEAGAVKLRAYEVERLAEVTDHLVAFFRRGRPMAYLSASDLFFCGPVANDLI